MYVKKNTWLLTMALTPFVIKPMQIQLTSSLDGGTLSVAAHPWYDLLPALKKTDETQSCTLPVTFSCIKRIQAFLTAEPEVTIEETPFDAPFAHELFLLNPLESSHAVHILTQQAAHTYNRLFTTISQQPLPDEHVRKLETFLNSCPAPLRMQINIYAYLLYAHAGIHGCLHEFFNHFVDPQESALRPSDKLMQHIEDLPRSRNQTLGQAALEHQEDVALYALALGADPTLPVRIKLTCHCCAQSFLVSHYQNIPLIKFCSHMPRLKEILIKQKYK